MVPTSLHNGAEKSVLEDAGASCSGVEEKTAKHSMSDAPVEEKAENGSEVEGMQPGQIRHLFKYYRRRDRPKDEQLDMSQVVDLRVSQPAIGLTCLPFPNASDRSEGANTDGEVLAKLKELGLKPLSEWSLSTFAHRPGLYILNGIMDERSQLTYLRRTLFHYCQPPNVTNLSAQGKLDFLPGSRKLRWATLGLDYNWSTKEYPLHRNDENARHLPGELNSLAKFVVQLLNLGGHEVGSMEPDAAIVNYYPPSSYLSPHVDRSERYLQHPLVSLSLGQSAIYLTGGCTLDDLNVNAMLLHSGDVLVMAGQQRLVYHGVPRTLKMARFDTAAASLTEKWRTAEEKREDKVLVEYASECRVNITIRQVDEANN